MKNKRMSELTVGEFMELTEAIIYKAIVAYEENKNQPDLISSNEAYRLVGRVRVEKLINMGLITRLSSGNGKNPTKKISRSKLLSLNNYQL